MRHKECELSNNFKSNPNEGGVDRRRFLECMAWDTRASLGKGPGSIRIAAVGRRCEVPRRLFSPSYRILCRAAALSGIAVGVTLAVYRQEPATDLRTRDELRQQLSMDEEAAAIFSHSCADCHSNHTRWHWYSYVPPVFWLIKRDVDSGRKDFDASAWSSYDVASKDEILAAVARVVTDGEMPLKQYLLIHRGARLSDTDAEVLARWAGLQRRQLAQTDEQAPSVEALPNEGAR